MLDENNKSVKAFRMSRDKFQGATITKLKLKLKSTRKRVGNIMLQHVMKLHL